LTKRLIIRRHTHGKPADGKGKGGGGGPRIVEGGRSVAMESTKVHYSNRSGGKQGVWEHTVEAETNKNWMKNLSELKEIKKK